MTKEAMVDEIMDILHWLCDRAAPDESGTPETTTIRVPAFSISRNADTEAVL
jgi:hypothetical protein